MELEYSISKFKYLLITNCNLTVNAMVVGLMFTLDCV